MEPLRGEVPHRNELHDVPRSPLALRVGDPHVVAVELLHQGKVRIAHPHAAKHHFCCCTTSKMQEAFVVMCNARDEVVDQSRATNDESYYPLV